MTQSLATQSLATQSRVAQSLATQSRAGTIAGGAITGGTTTGGTTTGDSITRDTITGSIFIDDTATCLHNRIIYLPIPIFWALAAIAVFLQSSRCVFQLNRIAGVQVCDATKADQGTKAGYKKIQEI